jgi:hypothetical protein
MAPKTSNLPLPTHLPLMARDYHGFQNLCGFWVGYRGVQVRVATLRPLPNPYPQEGLMGFGRFLGGNPMGFPNVDEVQICLH